MASALTFRTGPNPKPPVGRDWPQSQTDALVEYLAQRFGAQGEASGGG